MLYQYANIHWQNTLLLLPTLLVFILNLPNLSLTVTLLQAYNSGRRPDPGVRNFIGRPLRIILLNYC